MSNINNTKRKMYYSKKFLRTYQETGCGKLISLPETTSYDINYLDIVDTNISYLTTSRINSINRSCGNKWCLECRPRKQYITKPGKIFKKLFATKLTDSDIERLTTKFSKSFVDLNKTKIEIWPSNKISHAYWYKNYLKGTSGTLANSCMRYSEQQPLLEFYVKNKVEIIVLLSTKNKILGRALLWPEIKFKCFKTTKKFMDRIYTNYDIHLNIFKKFAEQQDFIRRCGSNIFEYKGETKEECICLPVNIQGIICVPYADTMKYLFVNSKILSNYPTLGKKKEKFILLESTSDYRKELDPNSVLEYRTGEYIYKLKSTYIKRYNGYVCNKNVVYLKNDKEKKTPYTRFDELICNTHYDGWQLKRNCIRSSLMDNKWILKCKIFRLYTIEEVNNSLEFLPGDSILDREDIKKTYAIPVHTENGIVYVTRDSDKYLTWVDKLKQYRLIDYPVKKKQPAVEKHQYYYEDVGCITNKEYKTIKYTSMSTGSAFENMVTYSW